MKHKHHEHIGESMITREELKKKFGFSDEDFVKPLPKSMDWTKAFWEAANQGQLVLKTCEDCGHIDHPPYLYCTKCGSHNSQWRQASGTATLVAFAVNTYGVPAAFIEDLPYVTAIVKLQEGPRMISNIVDCDHAALRNGMALEVVFDRIDETVVLPKWRPAKEHRHE
ncbi:MAG: Zn-ribbon domain-containing OB-fold protein [Burkholderiales bacterium]